MIKEIVTLVKGKKEFKHGDWLMFDVWLPIGTEVNIVKPSESGDSIRVFKVIKKRGFLHQLSAFDKRNKVSMLEKGLQFLYIKK